MLEAFNELMADPTSRAELVGGLVEVLLRYGTDRPRVIIGHATNSY